MTAPPAGPFEVRNVGLREIALVCEGEAVSLKPGETLLARRLKFSSGTVQIVAREGFRVDLGPVDEEIAPPSEHAAAEPSSFTVLPPVALLFQDSAEPLRSHRTTVSITAVLTLTTWLAVIESETMPTSDVAVMLLGLLFFWFSLWHGTTDWSIITERCRGSLRRQFAAVIALAICGAVIYAGVRWEPVHDAITTFIVAYFTLTIGFIAVTLIGGGAWLIVSKLARRH